MKSEFSLDFLPTLAIVWSSAFSLGESFQMNQFLVLFFPSRLINLIDDQQDKSTWNYSISSLSTFSWLSTSRTDDLIIHCIEIFLLLLLSTLSSQQVIRSIFSMSEKMLFQLTSSSFSKFLRPRLDVHFHLNKNIEDYWNGTRLSFFRLYRP